MLDAYAIDPDRSCAFLPMISLCEQRESCRSGIPDVLWLLAEKTLSVGVLGIGSRLRGSVWLRPLIYLQNKVGARVMVKAEIPDNEAKRIHALKSLNILDTPIQESFERITRLAKALFNVPIVAFSLVDKERQWFKSIQGLDVCETNRTVAFCAHAILQDNIFIVSDALKDERFANNPLVIGEPYIRFYAGYPVHTVDRFKIGTLCLIDTQPRDFTRDQLSPLKDLVALIESEIYVSKVTYEQSRRIKVLDHVVKTAHIDNVTRLWNRKAIEDLLKDRINAATNKCESLGIALIDIDNFKSINDTYGHCAGDQVLRNVAKRLLSGYRDCDSIGRWGGEEFLVILGVENLRQLFELADRGRQLVASKPFHFESSTVNVTVTTGVAILDGRHPEDVDVFVARADKALYVGKNQGKNIVISG